MRAVELEFSWREQSYTVLLGQIIVLGFLIAQCLGTLVKQGYRLSQDLITADCAASLMTLADVECFWISLSGVVIIVCSWVSLLSNRAWRLRDGTPARMSVSEVKEV